MAAIHLQIVREQHTVLRRHEMLARCVHDVRDVRAVNVEIHRISHANLDSSRRWLVRKQKG